MPIRLDVVGFAVRDMAAALRFYQRLGLDIPEVFDEEPHVEIVLEGFRLAWDKAEPVGHRIELAFRCDSSGDVDATYNTMMGHGYRGHKQPWYAPWGQRYSVIEDPDGNLISLYA